MLKHGILGLLNYGDMIGYEIMLVFRDSLRYFWSAQTSQIYRELDTLEEMGWIQKKTVPQSDKPAKNICSITEEGRKELQRWLAASDNCAVTHFPLLMKVFFMGELTPDESLAFFQEQEKQYRNALKALDQTENSIHLYQKVVPDPGRALFWQMTSDFGKRYAKMMTDWSQDCIHKIEEVSGKRNVTQEPGETNCINKIEETSGKEVPGCIPGQEPGEIDSIHRNKKASAGKEKE